MTNNHLFCFGLGYSATFLSRTLMAKGWKISGSVTSKEKQQRLSKDGYTPYLFMDIPQNAFATVTHLLHSIPPDSSGDPVLQHLPKLQSLRWIGYLSTTGVYGNHQGGWVDETMPVNPPNDRSSYRARAEQEWQDTGLPIHIFRLSGIYGPGRSAFDSIRNGTARRIDKPGQVFSRIHVEDIARVLQASIVRPNPGSIYNVADDFPCPQEEVISYACQLLGVTPPPLIPIEQADLSPMARSFYGANRRVSNDKIKKEFQLALKYPSYRDGLQSIYSLFLKTP